jgi:hypothetical protein
MGLSLLHTSSLPLSPSPSLLIFDISGQVEHRTVAAILPILNYPSRNIQIVKLA